MASAPQEAFFPIEDVRPGMVGIGRSVFAGDSQEEFQAEIVGVLRNVMGPNRDLILARLGGAPVERSGVAQGMSGSPIYIEGRLVGAVSYALGTFPKEPFAGITPIREMTAAMDLPAGPSTARIDEPWPVTFEGVLDRLARIAAFAQPSIGPRMPQLSVVGPASLADLAPTLRPIGAAMVMSGLEPWVGSRMVEALPGTSGPPQSAGPAALNGELADGLRPGDPVGMSLVRGDLEMGATGTVTHVDGSRVYAFGHPFLNLGPSRLAMTRAHVYSVLPSLDISMKIASLGPVIGTVNQDRATGVAGTLGAPPPELDVLITLDSGREPERQFRFKVLHDPNLTPLFAYVAVFNTLIGYERQMGTLSIAATGSVDFGERGRIAIDDVATGETAIPMISAATTAAIGPAVVNDFASVMPERLDLRLRVSERTERATIERVWLDTTEPRFGATHQLSVQLRNYRGQTETVTLPVTMPAHASGPLKLLVSDAVTLSGLEQRELRPGQPRSWPALLERLAAARRGNRLYVRLIDASAGTVVGGDTLPALPSSIRSVLESDATVASTAVSRTVVGAWERRFDKAITGSRELTLTLTSGR